jgi:hypothetical protein
VTPEAKVKVVLRRRLDALGCYTFMPVQTGYGATSLDFLVCWNGRFIAIETKAEGNKPTARQKLVAKAIIAAGGAVLVIDSVEKARNFDPRYHVPRSPAWPCPLPDRRTGTDSRHDPF